MTQRWHRIGRSKTICDERYTDPESLEFLMESHAEGGKQDHHALFVSV